jgi:hypothetical protein
LTETLLNSIFFAPTKILLKFSNDYKLLSGMVSAAGHHLRAAGVKDGERARYSQLDEILHR